MILVSDNTMCTINSIHRLVTGARMTIMLDIQVLSFKREEFHSETSQYLHFLCWNLWNQNEVNQYILCLLSNHSILSFFSTVNSWLHIMWYNRTVVCSQHNDWKLCFNSLFYVILKDWYMYCSLCNIDCVNALRFFTNVKRKSSEIQ